MTETVDVVVMIGNSDDKLGQREWAQFCADLMILISTPGTQIHGRWYSSPISQWKNAAICAEVPVNEVQLLTEQLAELAAEYRQDSIAVLSGKTTFIEAAKEET